jgi:hypothetical protein
MFLFLFFCITGENRKFRAAESAPDGGDCTAAKKHRHQATQSCQDKLSNAGAVRFVYGSVSYLYRVFDNVK